MQKNSTESALKDWRSGQIQSERLSVALLYLEGYAAVDPQHPFGGPDGGKDVVCLKGVERWVAAAHFPPTEEEFKDIKEKFKRDLDGARKNGADGVAFFVNQYLTLGQRDELLTLAGPLKTEIYHLERMRGLLDAPKGYGVRLEYLGIAMTVEEQIAFWSAMNYGDVIRKLLRNEHQLESIDKKLDLVLSRTSEILDGRQRVASSLTVESSYENIEAPMATLAPSTIGWIHGIVTENQGIPETSRGRFRSVQVFVADDEPGGKLNHLPPPPSDIVALINEYIAWWNCIYPSLIGAEKPKVVEALAHLHHRFLLIHPFLDGNGRVARILVDQAARELLNMRIGVEFVADRSRYFRCLQSADNGDIGPLCRLVAASLQ